MGTNYMTNAIFVLTKSHEARNSSLLHVLPRVGS